MYETVLSKADIAWRQQSQHINLRILWALFPPNPFMGFSSGSGVKNSPANAGDEGSVLGQEGLLEKKMATHSNTLAWEIPWTEKPGGLHSTGPQKVRHDF